MKNTNRLLIFCFLIISLFAFTIPANSYASLGDTYSYYEDKNHIVGTWDGKEAIFTFNSTIIESGRKTYVFQVPNSVDRYAIALKERGSIPSTTRSGNLYLYKSEVSSGFRATWGPQVISAAYYNASPSPTPIPSPPAPITDTYRLFPKLECTGNDALVCWLGAVWRFAQVAILVLAVAAMVVAGIIYMTSAGNPKQIAMAKKIIIGALSGVAVMILGRFFLVNIIGVEWIW